MNILVNKEHENDDYMDSITSAVNNQEVYKAIEIVSGTGKKSGKEYKALKITVGDWDTIVFPSKFELKYLESVL